MAKISCCCVCRLSSVGQNMPLSRWPPPLLLVGLLNNPCYSSWRGQRGQGRGGRSAKSVAVISIRGTKTRPA